jgi:hypothetical protein
VKQRDATWYEVEIEIPMTGSNAAYRKRVAEDAAPAIDPYGSEGVGAGSIGSVCKSVRSREYAFTRHPFTDELVLVVEYA